MTKKTRHILRSKQHTAFIFILAFIVIGIVTIIFSHAATGSVAIEAETGVLKAPATTTNDANASGGKAVKFGPAPNTGTLNTIDNVVYFMKGNHEAYMHGVPSNFDWAFHSVIHAGNDPGGFKSITFWGQAYGASTGPGAGYTAFPANSRIHVRNVKIYLLSRLDNKWHLVINKTGVNGKAYPEDFAGNSGQITIDLKTESDGGTSARMIKNYNFHFFPGRVDMKSAVGGNFNPQTDIMGVFATIQARMIRDDPTKPDDSATTKVVLSIGADYWRDQTASFCGTRCNNVGLGTSKAVYVTPAWKAFNFHTMAEADIRANPPPLE